MWCFPKWTTYRFKSQLQLGFGLLGLAVLGSIFLTVSIFTWKVTEGHEKLLRQRLFDTANVHMSHIVAESVEVFEAELARNAANFLSPLAYAASDWTRSDYVYADQDTFYEWKDLMAQPRGYDARFNSTVSFVTSGYSIARQNPYLHASSWPLNVNRTIQRTQVTSALMKSLYQRNGEFLTGYYCISNANHDRTSAKTPKLAMFREYPSVSNGNFNQMLAYDCSADQSWYQQAIDSVTSTAARPSRRPMFTAAYFDPWVRNTMITITQPVFHPGTGELLGAAGGDLLTSTIQASIQSVPYLTQGRAILFQVDSMKPSDGSVIADSKLSPNRGTTIPSVRTVTNPAISTATWGSMYQTDSNGGIIPTSVQVNGWYISCRGLGLGDNQYMLCLFVAKASVMQSLEPVLKEVSRTQQTTIMINCVICATLLVVAFAVTFLMARSLVAPVQKLTEDGAKLIGQIGQDDFGNSIELTPINSSIAETRKLQEAHRDMISSIHQQHAAAAAALQASAQHGQVDASAPVEYALPAYDPNACFNHAMLQQQQYAPPPPPYPQ